VQSTPSIEDGAPHQKLLMSLRYFGQCMLRLKLRSKERPFVWNGR
jgi:hypothetical protein